MKFSYTIFFSVFASVFFLNGQDQSRNGAQLMMEGIIQQRKAKEACERQDYIMANKWFDEALTNFVNAKKAFEKDKTGREKAKEQIALIRKEKEDCRPGNKNFNTHEIGARKLKISGIVLQKSTGTGGIAGHIANMTVSNFSDKEMKLCFSNQKSCPDNSVPIGMLYIPNEEFQDYVVFGPLDFIIPPNSTFIIPVTGVCVQPDKDPVPDAARFSKPDTWILESEPSAPFSLKGVRSQNKASGIYIANALQVWPEMPGSDEAIIVESGKNRPLTAALVFDAIQKIDSTIMIMNQNGSLQRSLFESQSVISKPFIKLYCAWYYVGVLTGKPYTYDDFEQGIFAQIDPNITADPNNRMSLVSETKKFWEQVIATIRDSGVLKGNLYTNPSNSQETKLD